MRLSEIERRAMARALDRAAEKLDQEAARLEALVEWRRKPHGDDAVIAQTLREVTRRLRQWARACVRPSC